MKAYKRFLAGLCAVATVFSITACSKDDEQSSSEYKQQVKVEVTASAEDIASLPGGEESTILYMGENDLNPTSDGQEKSVELKLFEEKVMENIDDNGKIDLPLYSWISDKSDLTMTDKEREKY